MTKLIYPENAFLFDTHTDLQNEFLRRIKEDGIDSALVWLEPEKNNTESSHPRSLVFSWETRGRARLAISKNEDLSDAWIYETEESSYEVENFEIGERYYWQVNDSEIRYFDTKNEFPRFIHIEGLLNVRDVGGVNIKQGLLYRGSELNRCFEATEKGKEAFAKQLGIKFDMDLRGAIPEVYHECPIEGVTYKLLPYRPYKEVFEDQHKHGIRKIMEFLAEESNYPVFFHCMGGADRTGMIALFMRALAGEEDDVIHTDYEMTGLSMYAGGAAENAQGFRRRNAPYYMEFREMLDEYGKGPFRDKVENFLLAAGVKQETIDKVKKIIIK